MFWDKVSGLYDLFEFDSYKQFFADMGYSNITYEIVDGRMTCALAIIKN